jgi:hypothetical protein
MPKELGDKLRSTVDGRKSCTTWDGRKPINNGKNPLLTGAGFLPSTVFAILYDVES